MGAIMGPEKVRDCVIFRDERHAKDRAEREDRPNNAPLRIGKHIRQTPPINRQDRTRTQAREEPKHNLHREIRRQRRNHHHDHIQEHEKEITRIPARRLGDRSRG
jgi:hypothetical protein